MTVKNKYVCGIVFTIVIGYLIMGCGADDDNELDALYEELVGTYDLFRAEVTLEGESKLVLEPPDTTGTMTISSNQDLVQKLVVLGIPVSVTGIFEIDIDEGIMLIDNTESDLISKASYTWDGEILTTTLNLGTVLEKDFWRKQ
ncbi:hypothetical protein JT359_09275 [Candidatus Poribacteria bacterium]|nr:hypothetical protein [Candidatus Poribacteria bacterium]